VFSEREESRPGGTIKYNPGLKREGIAKWTCCFSFLQDPSNDQSSALLSALSRLKPVDIAQQTPGIGKKDRVRTVDYCRKEIQRRDEDILIGFGPGVP
jgi:hypothetical protein